MGKRYAPQKTCSPPARRRPSGRHRELRANEPPPGAQSVWGRRRMNRRERSSPQASPSMFPERSEPPSRLQPAGGLPLESNLPALAPRVQTPVKWPVPPTPAGRQGDSPSALLYCHILIGLRCQSRRMSLSTSEIAQRWQRDVNTTRSGRLKGALPRVLELSEAECLSQEKEVMTRDVWPGQGHVTRFLSQNPTSRF